MKTLKNGFNYSKMAYGKNKAAYMGPLAVIKNKS